MKKKLSFIAVIFTMLAVMCVSAYAANNTVKTAKTIEENNPVNISFDQDTYSYYLKFIPYKTASYEIGIDNFVYDETYITVYNQYGVELDFGSTNEFTDKCICVSNLEANKIYYFLINCYSSESVSVKATVKKHIHTIVKEYEKKASYGIDGVGIRYDSCIYCDYYNSVIIKSISSISLSKTKYTYSGNVITPTVIVKNAENKSLKLNTDYTVKYSSGRKNPGRYAVKITFKGDYTGSETLYFDILPGITSKISALQSTNAIKLTWSVVPGATGYRVFLYNAKTKKYTTLANTTKNTYTVSKLSPGTNYTFAIRAYSTVGGKAFWSASYKTLATATEPDTPSLKVVAGTGKAVLTWNKQSGADGYVVYMSTSKDGKYTRIATEKGNSSVNYTKTGLTKGKTYYFKVAAYKTVGSANIYSSFSAVRYVKIK